MTNGQRSLGVGTFLVLPAFAVWALVAMGIVVHRPALQTARPEATLCPERPAVSLEGLPARLWQDPLKTAYQAHDARQRRDRTGDATSCFGQVIAKALGFAPLRSLQPGSALEAGHVLDRLKKRVVSNKSLLLLPVFLSGEAYSEDAENRIRTRYAVLSGLSVAGYVPEDRNHIGYFTMDYPTENNEPNNAIPARELIVPFEWYQRNPLSRSCQKDVRSDSGDNTGVSPAPWQWILVLWIDEDHFGTDRLAALAGVLGKLGLNAEAAPRDPSGAAPKPASDTRPDRTKCVVSVLGPTNSNALLEMLSEVDRAQPPKLFGATFYSPWATISERMLQRHLSAGGSGAAVPDLLRRLNLRRTVADDEETCGLLVRELELRRHPGVSREKMHVALIAEWDTIYARALPETFADLYMEKMGIDVSDDRLDPPQPEIRFYSYLQGIDGRLPGDQQTQGTDMRGIVAGTERPEGKAQLDYVRRLERQLRRFDEQLKRDDRGRLQAVGILGSDVYDKLLILRALKPNFPGVIFFTTDLDALLLHPDEQKWTRNLVVASSFGLRLCDRLQRRIPPFRESYQTSIFFATLRLLEHDGTLEVEKPTTRIYEIGQSGAYDLSVDDEEAAFPHPAGPRSQPWWTGKRLAYVAAMVVPAALLLLLVARTARGVARWIRRCFAKGRKARLAYPLGAAVVAGAMTCLIWLDHRRAGGEPFALFEGISIWPTELLRLLAVLISCCCCYKVWAEFGQDTDDIEKVLSPGPGEQRTPGGFFREMCRSLVGTFEYRRQYWRDVGELWREYHQRRGVASRVARTLLFVIFYFLTFGCLFSLLGPLSVPGRGSTSFTIDLAVILCSVLSMIVLLFLVLQRTQLCHWLIRQMLEHGARSWPAYARAEWVRIRRLPTLQPSADMDEWLTVHLIATHTDTIGRFIYYPFVVLFIMIVSRHPVFDGWAWPTALIVVTSFVFVVALYASVLLRRSAQRARRSALARLRETLTVVRELRQFRRAETIQRFVADIEAERGGAFSPPFNNPILHAFLIPSGGLGTLAVLEYLLDYL